MNPKQRTKPNRIEVPRWRPHDFAFQSLANYENPYSISFSAVVTNPDGDETCVLGFYDGDGTWKVRVSANMEGRWSLRTQSDEPELDGQEVEFTCIPNTDPNIHGGLLVDPEHPYHFMFEDGTRYFMMGYECDWLWALDMENPNLFRLNRFLDKLVDYGFNHILLNTYAHDCPWQKGRTCKDDYGPPPLYPWEGGNEHPVHNRFNLAYWRHYDRVIDALYRRGIIAHVMFKVYNKMVNWPQKGSVEDDMFFRWVVARYAAYPNIVWDLTKEGWREEDLEYKLSRIKIIRENDGYHRLVTVHDDDDPYENGAYDQLLDFWTDQNHSDWHRTIIRQRKRRKWPVANMEFGYEHGSKGLEDKTYRVVQPPEEVSLRAWEIYMAGGYAAYYYTYTAWDVIRPEDTPRGYVLFKRLREFFENTHYWLMEPADELVSDGYCLANPSREYIVFLKKPRKFRLKIEGAAAPLTAEWYNPFTGERLPAAKMENGIWEFKPPESWGDTPVALHLR